MDKDFLDRLCLCLVPGFKGLSVNPLPYKVRNRDGGRSTLFTFSNY